MRDIFGATGEGAISNEFMAGEEFVRLAEVNSSVEPNRDGHSLASASKSASLKSGDVSLVLAIQGDWS